jgi:predicted DNA-binding protein
MAIRSPNGTVTMHVNLSLLGDMPQRIDQARETGETRAAFIRGAIERELERRAYRDDVAAQKREANGLAAK